MPAPLFHLAFPVTDIEKTKAYYVDGLGCTLGRSNDQSAILDLYGHQLVAHVTKEPIAPQKGIYPRHFGLVFSIEQEWQDLLDRAQQKELPFYQKPKHRFPGLLLEHRTFFLADPFMNLMEFKYYAHPEAIFGGQEFTEIGDQVSDLESH